MPASPLEQFVVASIADRRLLEHPFYRRWDRGEVTMSELADYASQYRHFEAWLPGFLERLVDELPIGPARDFVAANLDDELGDPVPHVELFEGFAEGVGAAPAPPSPAMSRMLTTYGELADQGSFNALAGFVAYEYQAPEVARSKANGLRSHYGLTDGAVAFWEHHADVDVRHAEWALGAMGQFPGTAARARRVPAHRGGGVVAIPG